MASRASSAASGRTAGLGVEAAGMRDLGAVVRASAAAAGLEGCTVLVGVSGGSDSVALFHLLACERSRLRQTVHLCHVDHGWRPSAGAAESDLCRRLAERLGCGWSVVHLPRPPRANEAAARDARSSVLRRLAQAVGAKAVALGHQADDQAETVLMQLVRGTSAAAGMTPWRPPLWRPLLGATRRELAAYCEEQGLEWARDETNASPAFERNRLRMQVMPLLERENPRVTEALGRFAAVRAEEEALLDAEAGRALGGLPRRPFAIDLRPLATWPRAVQRRALRQLLVDAGIGADAGALLRFQSALEEGRPWDLPGGLRLERGLLWTVPPRPAWVELPAQGRLRWGALWFGVGAPAQDSVAVELGPGRLTLRTRRAGDRMRLTGGTRKLQDIFVDRGVPRPLRDSLPVVCLDGRPVWLPGLVRAVDAGRGNRVWAGSAEVVEHLWSMLE